MTLDPARIGRGPATVSDLSQRRIDAALSDALAPSTRRAYERHWRNFEAYCQLNGYQWLPADVDVVCEYLQTMELSGPAGSSSRYSVGYIDQVASAIRYVHREAVATPVAVAGESQVPPLWAHPKLTAFMRAMRNRAARDGAVEVNQEEPLLLDQLRAVLDAARSDADTWRKRLYERRDSAVLVLGWIGGMRRSELTAMRVRDVKFTYGKWTATIGRSKTDQQGKGQVKALPIGQGVETCPPCMYLRWMECVHVYDEAGRAGLIRLLSRPDPLTRHACGHVPDLVKPMSPVFRRITRSAEIGDLAMSDEMVNTIVRRRLSAAFPDLDVAEYGAHSLRAGFVTQGLLDGNNERSIMRQTGHRSMEGLNRYARERSAHDNNAATRMGL